MNLKKRAFLALITALMGLPLHASPLIEISEEYYEIDGQTELQLRDQMNEKRPLDHGEPFDAKTVWFVKWHYNYQGKKEGCQITETEVRANITYHLPLWSNEDEANKELQDHWKRYQKHLLEHERGHARNGQKAAREIETMLNNLAPFSSCPLLEEMANKRASDIIVSHHAWDLEYDRQTQHGRTQGAVFP